MDKMKKNISIFLIVFMITVCIGIVSAATKKKTKYATYSTTTISATATYYTHETTRWSISKPSLYKVSSKGGACSKSGTPKTSKSGNIYQVEQKFNVSATNYDYKTSNGVVSITWKYNAKSDKWLN